MLETIMQKFTKQNFIIDGNYNFYVEVRIIGNTGHSNSQIIINCFSNKDK